MVESGAKQDFEFWRELKVYKNIPAPLQNGLLIENAGIFRYRQVFLPSILPLFFLPRIHA